MKFQVKINQIESANEVAAYWTNQDFVSLLALFNYEDAAGIKPENLKPYLHLAISDFEPAEAAAILLTYHLSEHLNEGQIQQISHEMLLDKVCEEYPDITLHAKLFHTNQLLFHAYNGKFPNAKASIIDFSIKPQEASDTPISAEMVLKLFSHGLSDSNIIKRLFPEQLAGEVEFPEAESILWEFKSLGKHQFQLLTSEYWLTKEDFTLIEFEAEIMEA